ncbi:hypothetical protein BaRGS_00000373 [Batillaria attramentaria]|uniref:Leucine-rich repeat-containing protein 71 n=1 Tax=Batillaria attramentaria TaxID=370345 RepID=A0ABD0M9J5_9CAEN
MPPKVAGAGSQSCSKKEGVRATTSVRHLHNTTSSDQKSKSPRRQRGGSRRPSDLAYALASSSVKPEEEPIAANFKEDFPTFCADKHIFAPPVVPRPQPPKERPKRRHSAETIESFGYSLQKKALRGLSLAESAVVTPFRGSESQSESSVTEPEFKTFTTAEKFACFKPCVQIQTDTPEGPSTESVVPVGQALFIRGWKLDMQMVEILHTCWRSLQNLHTLNLWRVGLTSGTVYMLSCLLPLCPNLKTLLLDANPVAEQNFHELIEASRLQNLSLRHCAVTDEGARWIGKALGTAKTANARLFTLDLAGNYVTDVGAEFIAEGLRTNRTLLTLSLANNKISDKGAAKLAESLSLFEMTREEIMERRRLISIRDMKALNEFYDAAMRRKLLTRRPAMTPADVTFSKPEKKQTSRGRRLSISSTRKCTSSASVQGKVKKTSTSSQKRGSGTLPSVSEAHAMTKNDRRGSDLSTTVSDSSGVMGAIKESAETAVQDDSHKRGRSSSSSLIVKEATPVKRKKGKAEVGGKGKSKKALKHVTDSSASELTVVERQKKKVEPAPNPGPPLLEEVTTFSGKPWLPGNRILISLNLSRNKIGEKGLKSLIKAVQHQTALTQVTKICGKGLMRLVVHKNGVSADHQVVKELEELMRLKDPFYEASEPPAPSITLSKLYQLG